MIYFDTSYLARLYLEDPGWRAVRSLADGTTLACCVHGQAEVVAAFHRRLREERFTPADYRDLLEQFATDCTANGYHWLPLSAAVIDRLRIVYTTLPRATFLRAADALHLACAVENGFREVYSHDQHLLAAAPQFGLKGVNVI